ncbi:spermatogenesis-defective protein 39 homolog [Hyla sarda]|uniref:spermatogenesis-defective protein 39 homolog n=1 Tax=Hyla sarda TaxID=327740 RepID=UPI0024C3D9C9|nr:spermatogenesis-defective protein 39 homolog [Hyla sarda]
MSRLKADEEDYWHGSKCKAFTFEDEDEDGLSQLKESKRAVNSIKAFVDEEDEEEWEKFTWSGEPVGSISGPSRRRPTPGALGPGVLLQTSRGRRTSRPTPSPDLVALAAYSETLLTSRSALLLQDYSGDWSIEESVRRMQRGKMCSMERFRSLKDKLQLLDEAVRLHDGNVITAVLIFLKRTLRSDILFRELKTRQVALRHFIHFLKETSEQQQLMELLR